MNITLDVPMRDLLSQILDNNSLHTVLYFIGEIERVHNPEDWANHCVKLANTGEEV